MDFEIKIGMTFNDFLDHEKFASCHGDTKFLLDKLTVLQLKNA